jgi:hypothetical protein
VRPHGIAIPRPGPSGTRITFVLAAATVAGSLAGAASLLQLAFPVLAVAAAIWLLVRHRPVAYVEFTLWLWIICPGLRRFVDWKSEFHSNSLLLITAAIVSLLGLPFLFRGDRRAHLSATAMVSGSLLLSSYAYVVGLSYGHPFTATATFLLWVAPMALAAFVLFGPQHDGEFTARVSYVARWALLLLGGYGIVQWVLAPPWDVAWMLAVSDRIVSFGAPEPFEIRVFGLASAPFVYGHVLVWLLVSQLRQPPWRLRAVAVILGCAALGLSQVRAAWLTLAIVAVLLVLRRLLRLNRLLLIVGVLTTALLLLPESLTEVVTGRAQTLESAGSDVSFVARVNFYSHSLPQMLSDPLGGGMGSSFASYDSSYLEILRTYGGIFGAILVTGMLWIVLVTWWRTRRNGGPVGAWATFLAVLPVDMALGNVIYGLTGVITWLTIAMCASDPEPPDRLPQGAVTMVSGRLL